MSRLGESDLRQILAFVGDASAASGPDPFPPQVLELLRELVPSTTVSWHEWRVEDGRVRFIVSSPDAVQTEEVWAAYRHYRHEDPLPGGCEGVGTCRPSIVGRTVRFSDLVSRRAFRRTGLYASVCRPLGIDHVMKLFLPVRLGLARSFVFDRSGRDFGERDRLVVDVLLPHLLHLEEAARRRRLAASLAAAADLPGELVVLNAARRIEFATARARRLLDGFGLTVGNGALSAARDSQLRGGRPFAIENGMRRLELAPLAGHEYALVVAERPARPPSAAGLTSRELEILSLVGEGKSNAEVAAELWLAPGTVRKHLENVFAKLGVHTRTAAVAWLRAFDEAGGP